MNTYNKTIVAYCSTIIAALALYYVAFGALSERLLNELNVKDKFAYLVSDATALIFLTLIACAVGYCCSVITNHLVCVRNNERRIRAERAEVDAQVREAQSAIQEAMQAGDLERDERRERRESLRIEFGGAGLTVEVGTSAPERDAQVDVYSEVVGLSSEPFPKRGSECWTVGNEPHRYLADTGSMTPEEFRKQWLCEPTPTLTSDWVGPSTRRRIESWEWILSPEQVRDLIVWYDANHGAGEIYTDQNGLNNALLSLVGCQYVTPREADEFRAWRYSRNYQHD